MTFRLGLALSLWFLVAPLLTVYLYHGWMEQPYAIVRRASNLSMIPRDWVSGAILTGCIIVSFLSIMSFIDFLRMEWQPNAPRRPRLGEGPEEAPRDPTPNEIDNRVWNVVQQRILAQPSRGQEALSDLDGSDDSWSAGEMETDDEDLLVDLAGNVLNPDVDELDGIPNENGNRRLPRDDPAPPGGPPMGPVGIDLNDFEQMEDQGEVQIAIDEFLGLRGPVGAVARNVLWFLAFNAVYLGLFAFSPKIVGAVITNMLFNITDWRHNATAVQEVANERNSTILKLVASIEVESERIDASFRLQDVIHVTSGYLFGATVIVLCRGLVSFVGRFQAMRNGNHTATDNAAQPAVQIARPPDRVAPFADQMDEEIEVNIFLSTIMSATVASTKVGVLLFLKMFLLPIFLGMTLDVATLPVFGRTMESQVAFAGSNLFGFLLLHWVIGISFMLLVTVSVLQLREVVHPDILSQTIRPQEPQPDLLGNLMNDSVDTHVRRMFLSLLIYALLLWLHVYVPVRAVVSCGLLEKVGTIQLKYWYILMPELQIVLELLVFHLCMLALLEKFKNKIGQMQHFWLKRITALLGLAPSIIPMKINAFECIGTRLVFDGDKVSDFWTSLVGKQDSAEFIRENLHTFESPGLSLSQLQPTIVKATGEHVLNSRDFIRLPQMLPGPTLRSRSSLLPTAIGRYRLACSGDRASNLRIEVWVEVQGEAIQRPPEGWDDLRVGGADVQGRWAWGKEKKSVTEIGVARRDRFLGKGSSLINQVSIAFRLTLMIGFSWTTTVLFLCVGLLGPLLTGRTVYNLLHIPEHYIHDPTSLAVGTLIFFPAMNHLVLGITSLSTRVLATWATKVRLPPAQKMASLTASTVLGLACVPLLFGFIYHIAVVKPDSWFTSVAATNELNLIHTYWATGIFLLAIWSFFSIKGILTWRFWQTILQTQEHEANDDPAQEGNEAAAAWHSTGGNRVRLCWQGKYGRMSRFRECWRAVLLDCEYDKVDSTVLVKDVCVPMLACSAKLLLACFMIMLAGRTFDLSGRKQLLLTRTCLFLLSMVESARIYKQSLSAWYEVAHSAARDERYLIGEVLVDLAP